jgi:hypothetical protein
MAAHLRFPSARRSQYRWFESITGISTLRSNIIDGLGVSGLAANGMSASLSANRLSWRRQSTAQE